MNRQARLKVGGEWESYGPVGIIEAAKRHAAILNFHGRSCVNIEVRDADDPATVHPLVIRKVVSYVCENPRGDMQDE